LFAKLEREAPAAAEEVRRVVEELERLTVEPAAG
jgi:hypothetical protein